MVMKNIKVNLDLRVNFSKLDAAVVLTPQDVGCVIAASTVGAVYTALYRGDLPEPVIRANRRIRWAVGQIRDHIRRLEDALKTRQSQDRDLEGTADWPNKQGRLRSIS